MDEEIKLKLEAQEKKLEEIWKSVEKTRKYFLWTLIVTCAAIVLPLVALAFVIPWFLNIITSAYSGLM